MEFLIQQFANGIALGGVLALFALGFSLVVANMRVFHVAHAAVFTWGGVIAWHLTSGLGWGFVPALVVTAIGAGLLNVLVYFIALRHLEGRKNKELAAFVSSLGALMILTQLADITLSHVTVRLPFDLLPIHVWRVGGVQVSSTQVLMLAMSVVMFILLRWLLVSTQIGREMRATAYDREIAGLLGVRTNMVTGVVFFLSGSLAGIGAVLVAIAFNQVSSSLGGAYMLLALAVMVIGGFGSVAGTFVAGLLLGLISSFTTAYVTSSFREVVIFGLLMLFLGVRPAGLFRVADSAGRP